MKKTYLYLFILIVLAALAYWMIQKEESKKSTYKPEKKNFHFRDTARVAKVFIAKRDKTYAILERKENGWQINEKYKARQDRINSLLKAICRVEVLRPVALAAKENAIKRLASKGTKVELYGKVNNEYKPIRTFYIGGSTNDNRGTYMMIEGSELPFITHIPGWEGYLSTRFFTKEDEWRDPGVFTYKPEEIKQIKVDYKDKSKTSFVIQRVGNNFSVQPLNPETKAKSNLDSSNLATYINYYKWVIVEGFENQNPRKAEIIAREPLIVMQVTNMENKTQTMKVYVKYQLSTEGWTDQEDVDHNYIHIPETDEFGLIQDYATSNKIFKDYSYFFKD